MRKYNLRHLSVLAVSLVGASLLSGCDANRDVYRTYYQDATCRYFYVDYQGNRVYSGGPRHDAYVDNVGRTFQRDANGRLYWQDSFGNRFYMARDCR